VAFVEDYEKSVSFTFEYPANSLRLKMEDLYQAKELYHFFNDLFKDYSLKHSGLGKSLGTLYSEWEIDEKRLQELIKKISELMGELWAKAFHTITSVRDH